MGARPWGPSAVLSLTLEAAAQEARMREGSHSWEGGGQAFQERGPCSLPGGLRLRNGPPSRGGSLLSLLWHIFFNLIFLNLSFNF